MSADDFQSKYASVMESMLKSAIAETTKLFANMVDELKEEISQIKKENEDLKTRCSQYETAKTQLEAPTREIHPVTEPGDAFVKCDSAIQCDLVPCRTVRVEECEPLIPRGLENNDHQYSYEWNSLQEHDYVRYSDRTSQVEFAVVKKESQLKQEDDEFDVACGQVLDNSMGIFGVSVGDAQIGGPNINNSLTVPPKNPTPVVFQLQYFEKEIPQVVSDQSTDMRHSLVISLRDALRDDIKEEAEMIEVSKQELSTSEDKRMIPEACHMSSATTHNQPTPLESTSVSTETEGGELSKVLESVATAKPTTSSGRRRGRPPKKRRQKQTLSPSTDKDPKPPVDLKTSAVGRELADPPPLPENSIVTNLLVKEAGKISLEEDCIDAGSLTSTSGNHSSVEVQAHSPEMEKGATADKTPNATLSVPSQASSTLVKASQTSVSLQDALLLVEAMNQSTMESSIPPLKDESEPQITSSCASSETVVEPPAVQQTAPVETPLTLTEASPEVSPVSADLIVAVCKIANLQNVATPQPPATPSYFAPPSPPSAPAIQTVMQSLPLPLTNRATRNKGARTVIILPRPSFTPNVQVSKTLHSESITGTVKKMTISPSSKAAAKPPEAAAKPPEAAAKPPEAAAKPPEAAEMPPEAPAPSTVPKKMIKVVYRKHNPIKSLHSSTILTDKQYVAPQTISIVSEAIPSGTHGEPEPGVLAAKQSNEEVVVVVPPESSEQMESELPSSQLSHSDDVTLLEKITVSTDDLNYPGQISSLAESTMDHGSEPSFSEPPVDTEQPSVSSALPQAIECKLSPVVKLTRLPLSISTKESVLISMLPKGIIQGNLSCAHIPEEEDHLTPELEQDIVYSDMENEQDATIPQDTSDPHVQMTKTQFLAKLSVTPLENESSNVNKGSNAEGAKSIVSRLRSHLQAHLEAKRSMMKQAAEKELEDGKNVKKPRLNVQDSTEEPHVTLCTVSQNKMLSTESLGVHKDGGEADDSRMSVSTKESPNVGFKKPSSSRHGVGSKKLKSTSVSSRQSSSQKSTNLKITKFISVSRKTPPSNGNISTIKRSSSVSPKSLICNSPEIPDVSTPKSTKSSSPSPKRLTKVASSPEKTKSSATENSSCPKISDSPSCSTSPIATPKTKTMKREHNSFTPRRYIVTADRSVVETTSESETPSPKRPKMRRSDFGLEMAGEPSSKKQLKGHRGRKKHHKVVSTGKGRGRVGKKRGSYKKKKLELPVVHSGVVGKCRAKVWYPPTLPPDEEPITEIIRPPPLKVEYRVPNIPLSAPPIVSPLQPLAVIGRHLLRNQCGECGRVFSNTNALESHVSLHKIYRPFSCKLCGKYFPDAKTFKRHDRVHRNGRIHVCQHCGKGFVYRFGLSKHIQMVHGRLRPFICQVCGNGFYTKRDVEIHIRIHTGEKPFQCHICERRFTRKVELNVHLRWHNGEKRHWCQYCGKGFLDYNNLKRHKYTHTGEKPFSCPHCPKCFSQTGHLKKHVQNVHKK